MKLGNNQSGKGKGFIGSILDFQPIDAKQKADLRTFRREKNTFVTNYEKPLFSTRLTAQGSSILDKIEQGIKIINQEISQTLGYIGNETIPQYNASISKVSVLINEIMELIERFLPFKNVISFDKLQKVYNDFQHSVEIMEDLVEDLDANRDDLYEENFNKIMNMTNGAYEGMMNLDIQMENLYLGSNQEPQQQPQAEPIVNPIAPPPQFDYDAHDILNDEDYDYDYDYDYNNGRDGYEENKKNYNDYDEDDFVRRQLNRQNLYDDEDEENFMRDLQEARQRENENRLALEERERNRMIAYREEMEQRERNRNQMMISAEEELNQTDNGSVADAEEARDEA
jgi:hypothetical protein